MLRSVPPATTTCTTAWNSAITAPTISPGRSESVRLKMMRLKIVQAGEPVLRQIGRALSPAEIALPAIQELIEHMRDTMRDAPGVGLAAPQIGLAIQLAVVEDRP